MENEDDREHEVIYVDMDKAREHNKTGCDQTRTHIAIQMYIKVYLAR